MRLNYSNFGSGNLGATYNPYGSQGFTPGFSAYGSNFNQYNAPQNFGQWWQQGGAAGLGSSLGGIFGSLVGGGSAMNAASPYANQIPGMLQQYLSPYMQQGQGINLNPYIQQGQSINLNPYVQMGLQTQPLLQQQLTNLAQNPTQLMNQIGSSYQSSPGYKFAVEQGTQQATDAANRAAAAGGLVGSPGEQQSLAKYITQMASGYAGQDYNNYMQNALNQYRLGLGGLSGLEQQGLGVAQGLQQQGLGVASGLEQQGFGATGMLSQGLGNYLQAMAQMAAAQQQAQNQQAQSMGSGIGGLIGSLAGILHL